MLIQDLRHLSMLFEHWIKKDFGVALEPIQFIFFILIYCMEPGRRYISLS